MTKQKIDFSIFIILIIGVLLILIANGCKTRTALTENLPTSENAAEKILLKTPADRLIEKAEKLIAKNPEAAESHVQMAMAILKKVRETGNYELNRRAEVSIKKALEIEPGNFAAKVLKIQIYLSEHEFQKALELAEELNKDVPDFEAVLAAITDAKTELGRYGEAVEAAQKFVDFRPNANSYARVAHLRSLYGMTDGAIEARKLAIGSADPADQEILAWHFSQLGKEYFNIGRFSEAESVFDRALKIFPDYHWALAGKGKVRAAQNDLETAVSIYEKLNERTFEPERALFLGDLYKKLGRTAEAEKVYKAVIRKQKQSGGDMHRIALFWADNDMNLDEALKIASEDRRENADLHASDTLAWCLYKTGNYKEAKKYISEAMRLGTKNALFYYHAGMIENKLGNKTQAERFLKLSLKTNPAFDLLQAKIAEQTLVDVRS